MKTKIKKIWALVFNDTPNIKDLPLQIRRKSVNIDTNLQRILLNTWISTTSKNKPDNISTIIRRRPENKGENGTN